MQSAVMQIQEGIVVTIPREHLVAGTRNAMASAVPVQVVSICLMESRHLTL